jgi:maltose alpha-D-glucosyltransferase/alpha-amylase
MHLALASGTSADFKPEPFSLHYQRSLYASMLSLVRDCFKHLRSKLAELPQEVSAEGRKLLDKQQEVLAILKRIYAKKLDTIKIRVHGHYTLREILITGKDISIQGFGGNPYRAFSERRLKRSPVLDVANMLRSLHNVAYEGTFLSNLIPAENIEAFIPYTRLWASYISGFFLKAYLDTVAGNLFVPSDKEDFMVMLQTYLLEKSLLDLRYELDKRPDMVIVPIKTILEIIE